MTRRLLLAPLVIGVIGGVGTTLYLSGLLWPIAGQVWSLIAPRPCNEADYLA